jgi:uncharacterized protein YbjT (DUF2867 family)
VRILLFGATGMIGQGVLKECLTDPRVNAVLSIGRNPLGETHPKLKEIVHGDLTNYAAIEEQLRGADACFFCLGTTSAGKSEAEYTKITYDVTVAIATTLAKLNPTSTFIYVSAEGADSSETSKIMWARVRGRTENAVLKLPFKGYVFRPGFVQPLDGIQSRTTAYRLFYKALWPLLPAMRALLPGSVSTTKIIGLAMIGVAHKGFGQKLLRTPDFARAAKL